MMRYDIVGVHTVVGIRKKRARIHEVNCKIFSVNNRDCWIGQVFCLENKSKVCEYLLIDLNIYVCIMIVPIGWVSQTYKCDVFF